MSDNVTKSITLKNNHKISNGLYFLIEERFRHLVILIFRKKNGSKEWNVATLQLDQEHSKTRKKAEM